MAWDSTLIDLQNVLAKLYPREADWLTFVDSVGLDRALIIFDARPLNTWHAILDEALKQDKLEAVLQVALKGYSGNADLSKAAAAYRESAGARRVEPVAPAHIFLSYQHHLEPDEKLAEYLFGLLTERGHQVFIDRSLLVGDEWFQEIDRQIRDADFLVVLLSEQSADSEMVQSEVRRAFDYRKRNKKPRTLPVRIAYEGLLPYSIDSMLGPLQYVVWSDETSNEQVGRDILAVVEDRKADQASPQATAAPNAQFLSPDGRPISDEKAMHRPLPAFDPRYLENLEVPSEAAKLSDKMYIERAADARLKALITRPGQTVHIRAPRQTGKSSLLARGQQHAREHGIGWVYLDFQEFESDRMATYDVLLYDLGQALVRKLRLDPHIDAIWNSRGGPQTKLTNLVEDHVLPSLQAPMVLALDEVDRVLLTPFYKDFFSMLRSWHNNRAMDERWNQMSIVMAISTEPFLLIRDLDRSPFNVGTALHLDDLDAFQVAELNGRHGAPLADAQVSELVGLLDGHPYLTRKALYGLVVERAAWPDLLRVAATDQGPFGEHLRSQYWYLRDNQELLSALKNIVHRHRCPDDRAFYRLLRAGLVKGSMTDCRCRCGLYRQYFQGVLQ